MRIPTIVLVSLAALSSAAALAGQTCEGKRLRNEADFTPLAGGAQLFDHKTGLIWDRCIEGQQWTGATCKADDPQAVNPGPSVTYAEAQKLAAAKATDAEKWRLPTKAELVTLREPDCYNPSLNLNLFPTDPAWSSDGFYWTSTRESAGMSLVDAIGQSDAWSKTGPTNIAHVRLVRTAPKETK